MLFLSDLLAVLSVKRTDLLDASIDSLGGVDAERVVMGIAPFLSGNVSIIGGSGVVGLLHVFQSGLFVISVHLHDALDVPMRVNIRPTPYPERTPMMNGMSFAIFLP